MSLFFSCVKRSRMKKGSAEMRRSPGSSDFQGTRRESMKNTGNSTLQCDEEFRVSGSQKALICVSVKT